MNHLSIPDRFWYRFSGSHLAIVNALNNKLRVQYWLTQARECPETRSMCVSYARAAHRAYLGDLERAVEYAERRL